MADAMPVVKGTLDVLVLKALSWGPMHGFEVTTWLEERSGLLVPRIRGRAFVTGRTTLYFDAADPFREGFTAPAP